MKSLIAALLSLGTILALPTTASSVEYNYNWKGNRVDMSQCLNAAKDGLFLHEDYSSGARTYLAPPYDFLYRTYLDKERNASCWRFARK